MKDRDKFLMTSFVAGNFVDIGVTSFALNLENIKEAGVVASGLVEQGRFDDAAIFRTGVALVMIGLFALTKKNETRFEYSFEKALAISNTIVWGVNLLNIAQVGYTLLQNS